MVIAFCNTHSRNVKSWFKSSSWCKKIAPRPRGLRRTSQQTVCICSSLFSFSRTSNWQRWRRGHNLRGPGQRLQKIRGQGQWCRFMLSIGGIICKFTPILPIFNIGRMKLDHYFFHVSKSSEDQKKVFTETERVFVPKIK